MPKSASFTDRFERARKSPRDGAWVYEKNGVCAFRRVGNDVYAGSQRVYHIADGAVYDAHGDRQFYIADLWWYTYDGKQAYYQDREVPEDGNEVAGS